ncbi:MAG: hypothetical protein HZA91_20685 [Verrucomicrobia bacterium]|nr:hypothetical protein [Verrucomicrobiota bacterium]
MNPPSSNDPTLFGYPAGPVKGVLWLLTINVCWLVSGFLVGRFLPVKTYGELQFFCAVLMTLGIFTLPGGKTAVVQSVARGYDGSLVEYVRARIRHSLAGSGVLLAMTGWCFVRGGRAGGGGLDLAAPG